LLDWDGRGAGRFLSAQGQTQSVYPPLVWWLCLILGAVSCFYGLSHSTAPSFATRITAVGRAHDDVERRQGRDTIETEIILPAWANPDVFNGRTFRVVYLDDNAEKHAAAGKSRKVIYGELARSYGKLGMKQEAIHYAKLAASTED
jgi:hypothetical protein